MALCRCLQHPPRPERTKKEYVAFLKPIGYPNTSSICGISNCENPAVIWIGDSEVKDYESGRRVFAGQTSVMKMKADDSGIHK